MPINTTPVPGSLPIEPPSRARQLPCPPFCRLAVLLLLVLDFPSLLPVVGTVDLGLLFVLGDLGLDQLPQPGRFDTMSVGIVGQVEQPLHPGLPGPPPDQRQQTTP